MLMFAAISIAHAQRRGSDDKQSAFLGAAFELGLPSNSPISVGYGASLKGEVPFAQSVALTLTAAYMSYSYNDSFISFAGTPQVLHPQFAPLKAGIRFQAGPGFYTEAELGEAIRLNNGSGGLFDYSVGLGFFVPVDRKSVLDIGIRYEAYSETQYRQTALKVAYRFGW
ncbi:hypothetical protein BEL04_12840 [Mucilaginibacter sp. PPCGB 2223]|nr:hypothetical protein BEL04_12840 [Mucilaginibacter sp. PPCGB 2223]